MIDLAHATRAQQALRVLVRHLDADVARAAAVEPALQPDPSEVGGDPMRLARDLEDLGPTFVKLGQTLATRADLLPPAYLDALGRLHDDVAPVPVETVRATVEDELGHAIDDLFAWFDDTPLAAASLCQVHRARLANGREVVVKVQRPDVGSMIRTDIDLLESAAHVLDDFTDVGRRFAFSDMIDSFRQSLVAELDLRNEAANLDAFAAIVRRVRPALRPSPGA